MVEIFVVGKSGPVDYGTLQRLIDAHKRPDADTDALFDRMLDFGILGQPLSSETLYQLGGLAETIVSQLLQEHRLGLSDSIQAHITSLDKLSRRLLQATTEHDGHAMADSAKKLWQHMQDIKRQVHDNLLAIRNIVAEAKQQKTNKPLRQRYTDVIDAWEQYITPMGDMIEAYGAFDSIIDSAVERMGQAIGNLDSAGALISEVSNIDRVRQMLDDVRRYILRNFQLARDILKPLYEVARLNSKVTRGASIVLEDLRKGRVRAVEDCATLPICRRPRLLLISPDNALLTYYYGVKEVKERPAPKITLPTPDERKTTVKAPVNNNTVLKQIKKDLPIKDMMSWAIEKFPDHSTDKILDIVSLAFSRESFCVERGRKRVYQTTTHCIEGPSLAVEIANA